MVVDIYFNCLCPPLNGKEKKKKKGKRKLGLWSRLLFDWK